MAFGSLNHSNHSAPLAEINMIPLIDVVLVLLIIFMITAPMMSHTVKLDLPQAVSSVDDSQTLPITISINQTGELFWNNTPVTADDLSTRFSAEAQLATPAELRIRADKHVDYGIVAEVMASASRAGLVKIGFVTEPNQ